MRRVTCAGLAAIASWSAPAVADHTTGHDDSDPTWPVPIPGQEFFDGGAAFVTAFGPYGGWEITRTTFDITYVSDGATPASDIAIDVSLLMTTGFMEFHVTGADLGFGSGPGTFVGSLSTSELNGFPEESFLFPPFSQINISIGSVFGGIAGSGYFVDSAIIFDVTPVPAPSALALLGIAGLRDRRRREVRESR